MIIAEKHKQCKTMFKGNTFYEHPDDSGQGKEKNQKSQRHNLCSLTFISLKR